MRFGFGRNKNLTVALAVMAVSVCFGLLLPGSSSATDSAFEAKCTTAKSRLKSKLTQFDSKKTKHVQAYVKVQDYLDEAVGELEELDADTEDLDLKLDKFDGKIETFKSDYQKFSASLKALSEFDCSGSDTESEFEDDLDDLRDLLKEVIDDIKDVSDYYKNEIKDAIRSKLS